MAAIVFDQLLARGIRAGQIPAREAEARQWYREKAQKIARTRVSPEKMLAGRKVNAPGVGRMYHFQYDPKLKQTLPYYDVFPLIFMVGPAPGGFYGLNLHYLPPTLRAKLMDALYGITTNKKFDASTKLALSYNTLKGAGKYKYFKPTFKHYLWEHVQSPFIPIESAEWDIALFLPTHRFRKASSQKVYSDSRSMI
jgi:hypothetical protein